MISKCIRFPCARFISKQVIITEARIHRACTSIVTTRAITTTPPSARLSFFAWYSQKLDTNPIMTKCISALFVTGAGNVISQSLTIDDDDDNEKKVSEQQHTKIDWNQAGRFALLNAVVAAPALHYWYNYLNRLVPGTTVLAVIKRVAWDEFVFAPLYLPVFLASLWAVEGSPLHTIPRMVYEEVPSILMAEWIMWIPTMALTFRYIPVKFQVLLINTVGIVWYTFLSYTAKKAHTKHGSSVLDEKVKPVPLVEKIEIETAPMYEKGERISALSTKNSWTIFVSFILAQSTKRWSRDYFKGIISIDSNEVISPRKFTSQAP